MGQVLSRQLGVDGREKAGSGQWDDVVANALWQEMAQEDTKMDGEVGGGMRRVVGVSRPYEVDSWDNRGVGEGIAPDDVDSVHEMVEPYTVMSQAVVEMNTPGVEGRRSTGTG